MKPRLQAAALACAAWPLVDSAASRRAPARLAAVPNITLIEGDRSKLAAQLADVDGVIGPFDLKLLTGGPS